MLDVRRTASCLEVEGALDSDGAQLFLLAVENEPGPVRVDASRVRRIDAAGLTALAVARSRCRAEGRSFALTGVAPTAVRELRVRDDVLRLFGPVAQPEASAVPDDHEPRAVASPPRRFSVALTRRRRHHGT